MVGTVDCLGQPRFLLGRSEVNCWMCNSESLPGSCTHCGADMLHTVYGDSRIQWSDQDGTSTSSESVQQSLEGLTAEEPNMDVSSSKTNGSLVRAITDRLPEDDLVLLANVLEECSQTKSVNHFLLMRIASLSMQSKTQLLTLVALILEVPPSTLLALSATCVENLLKPQVSTESSGPVEKNGSMSLTDYKLKLWKSSTEASKRRVTERNAK